MSENESRDDQDPGFPREGKSGLSLPRDDTGSRPTGPRARRDAGLYDKLRRAGQASEDTVARWFVPAAALVVLLFIVNTAMYFSQSSELSAWQSEVAALRQQLDSSANQDLRPEIERIGASVEDLGTRLDAIEDTAAEVKSLRTELARVDKRIEALGGRVDELEQASSDSGGTADSASGSQAPQAAAQAAEGEWVINLITVSDPAAAEGVRKRLDGMGVESRIEAVTRDGKSLHRVVVPGYESLDAARSAAPDLKNRLELSGDPWIARQ